MHAWGADRRQMIADSPPHRRPASADFPNAHGSKFHPQKMKHAKGELKARPSHPPLAGRLLVGSLRSTSPVAPNELFHANTQKQNPRRCFQSRGLRVTAAPVGRGYGGNLGSPCSEQAMHQAEPAAWRKPGFPPVPFYWRMDITCPFRPCRPCHPCRPYRPCRHRRLACLRPVRPPCNRWSASGRPPKRRSATRCA